VKVTPDSSSNELVAWARQVQALAADHHDAAVSQAIDTAIQQYEANRFLLAVVGKTKRGKSTLVNALLGRRDDVLAPISKMPASSVITRFIPSEEEKATIFYRDGRQNAVRHVEVRDYVTEDRNPKNQKDVLAVEVTGPFRALPRDTVLLDTPGSGSMHTHHDALLHGALPQVDAVIFMVTARLPLDQDEVDLLNALKKADIRKVFFVINMVDASEEDEIQEGIEHNLKVLAELGIESARSFFRISAKKAFDGNSDASGVPALLQDLRQFLTTGKGRLLNERFIARVSEKVAPLLQSVAIELASAGKSSEQLEQELRRLRQTKDKLQDDRDFASREFATVWTREVGQFAREVRSSKAAIIADVRRSIDEASSLKLDRFGQKLPSLIAETVEGRLKEPAMRLESQLKQACARLEVAFPSLVVDDLGAVSVRTKAGHTLLIGGVAATALGAGGIGLVVAGSTAAASIAATNAAAVAAMATAGALSLPVMLGSVLSAAGTFLGGPIGAVLSSLALGTAAPAASTALLATPAWVALSGPIGWTLTGITAMAIPVAWRINKDNQKDKLEQVSVQEIERVIGDLEKERVPALGQMGTSIIEEFNVKLDRQLAEVERTLSRMIEHRPAPEKLLQLENYGRSLSGALGSPVAPKEPT
jgi:ribosome biogenesis GTPase A